MSTYSMSVSYFLRKFFEFMYGQKQIIQTFPGICHWQIASAKKVRGT